MIVRYHRLTRKIVQLHSLRVSCVPVLARPIINRVVGHISTKLCLGLASNIPNPLVAKTASRGGKYVGVSR